MSMCRFLGSVIAMLSVFRMQSIFCRRSRCVLNLIKSYMLEMCLYSPIWIERDCTVLDDLHGCILFES